MALTKCNYFYILKIFDLKCSLGECSRNAMGVVNSRNKQKINDLACTETL